MNNPLKRTLLALICIFISLSVLLSACAETTTADLPDGESTSSPETTAEPEVKPERLDISGELVDGFAPKEIYHVDPTEREESVSVALKNGQSFKVDMSSTFYGSESAIDRDTFHWGNLYRYTKLCDSELKGYRLGDLTGDRRAEFFTLEEGLLKIFKMPQSSSSEPKLYYTAELGQSSVLCGAGLFDGDHYTDILVYDKSANAFVIAYGGKDGFEYFRYKAPKGFEYKADSFIFTGDYDGDGVSDLIIIDGISTETYGFTEKGFELVKKSELPFAEEFVTYAVADMNSDGASDIVAFMKDPDGKKNSDGNEIYGTITYMSRRDGHYGSYESEGDNENINPRHINEMGIVPLFAAGGDVTGDGNDDVCLLALDPKSGKTALYSVLFPVEATAYDYSSHIIKTDEGYILYTGGLYTDYNTDVYRKTDGDHITAYTSKDGINWHRNLDGACFPLGAELGHTDYQVGDAFTENWWINNTMEPEVLYVDGVYYMYYQVENYTYNRDGSLMGADRIGVATSTDGIHFERKTDSPALISTDKYSCFTHQEVIYVPDDPDGLCFWMYVRYVRNNAGATFIRVRSADPTCFDMNADMKVVNGFSQIGNQIGYISDYDGKGNRLFLRITFADYSENGSAKKTHTVPTLQFSHDGINWVNSDIRMAGTDMNEINERKRPNIYFLGFSTVNGTGEIAKTPDGKGYEFFYIGCTSTAPVAPAIFESSEGVGKAVFTITVE